MQLEVQKRIIEYTSLHAKRAEVIAELYAKVVQPIQRNPNTTDRVSSS